MANLNEEDEILGESNTNEISDESIFEYAKKLLEIKRVGNYMDNRLFRLSNNEGKYKQKQAKEESNFLKELIDKKVVDKSRAMEAKISNDKKAFINKEIYPPDEKREKKSSNEKGIDITK